MAIIMNYYSDSRTTAGVLHTNGAADPPSVGHLKVFFQARQVSNLQRLATNALN